MEIIASIADRACRMSRDLIATAIRPRVRRAPGSAPSSVSPTTSTSSRAGPRNGCAGAICADRRASLGAPIVRLPACRSRRTANGLRRRLAGVSSSPRRSRPRGRWPGARPAAGEASVAAIAAIDPRNDFDLAESLQPCTTACGTREGPRRRSPDIPPQPRSANFAGIGNMAATAIYRPGGMRHAVSLNGTLGHEARAISRVFVPVGACCHSGDAFGRTRLPTGRWTTIRGLRSAIRR